MQECIGTRWMTGKWGRFVDLSNLYKFCSSFLFTLVFPKQIFTYIPTHRLTEGQPKNPWQFPYFLWTGGYCNKPVPLDFHLVNDVPLPSFPTHLPSIHLPHTTQTFKSEDAAKGLGEAGRRASNYFHCICHSQGDFDYYFQTEHMPPVLKIFFC